MKEANLLFHGLQLTFLPRKVYVIVMIKTALIFSQQKNDGQHEKTFIRFLHKRLGVSGGDDDVDVKQTDGEDNSDFSDNIYIA